MCLRIISPGLFKLLWPTDTRGGGGVYSSCNRDENKKWFPINAKAHDYFILAENPIILVKYIIYTEEFPITLNHHRNTPFHDEGGGGARESNLEPDITQCVYIPQVDLLELYKMARVHSTRFGIPIFWNKDSKRGQYVGISREEVNIPDEYYLTSFKEDGCCDQQRFWMPNIRCIIIITARTINLNNIKQSLCFAMNIKTKGKGNVLSGVYVNTTFAAIQDDLAVNTSVSVTRNVLFEVSHTGENSTLVVFDHDLSKKLILIGDYKVETDLSNVTSIAHWKLTPLLDGGKSPPFSTAQHRNFVMAQNGVAKHHNGKKNIHDGDKIILMKSGKALVYAPFQEPPFQEPIHQYSGNLPCYILILGRVRIPSLINNSFEIKLIFHNHNEVDDDHHIRSTKSTYYHFKGPFGLITIYCTKDIFNHFNQLVYYFIFMPLNR